jgi:hypothetical protein
LSDKGDGSIRDGRLQAKVPSQQVEEMKMENNSRNRSFVVVAALAGLAVLMTLVLRDTATIHAAMKQKAIKKLAQSGKAVAGTDAIAYVTSAPYRDGLFQGKLARERGELGRVSAGRWSSQLDRSAYTDGYLEGFGGPANSSSKVAVK